MLNPRGTNRVTGSGRGLLRKRLPAVALPLLAGLWFAPVMAQDAGGGVVMSFGFSQRLESTDNAKLSVSNPERSTTATTRLSFGLLSETQISRLSFDASAALRAATGAGADGTERGLINPRVALSYTRSAADSSLELNGSLSVDDISNANAFSIFDPDTGELIDRSDETGTGTKRSYSLNAKLNLAQTSPLSYSLSAGISGVDYSNTSNPDLVNSQRRRAGITARLALTEVATATVGLRYATFDEDIPGSTTRVTTGLDTGLSIERPDGVASANLGVDHTPDGNRITFSLGRSYELPRGAFSANIGATRGVTGSTGLTGALSYRQDLPRGQFSASLRRSFSAGSDDSESRITALSLGYSQELTPLSGLNLSLDYSDNTESSTGATTTAGSFGATYSHQLTEDWGLDLGYRHQMRKDDGAGRANSNTVFLELSRSFDYRP